MATGRLGATFLTTTSATSVYTCPASTFAVVTVNVCNQTGSTVTVNIAVSSTSSPSTSEYIEFGSSLLGNGVLERTGIVMDAGKQIVVTAGTGSAVSAVVMGIETSTS